MRALLHCLLTVLFVSTLFTAKAAQAQTEIEMDLAAAVEFGEGITFTARLKAPLSIVRASIFVHDSIQGVTYSAPVFFDSSGVSQFRFEVRKNALRPFTTLLWRYELTLADGSLIRSVTGAVRYDDTRFPWQTLEADSLKIHWYNAGDDFGLAALNAAQAGLQTIGGFFVPDLSQPIEIYLYASESDLRGALAGVEAWAAGHADSAAGVITVTVEADAEYKIVMEQRIPHELMHVLLARQIGAGYRNLPAWLREGMAGLAEGYPNPEYERALADAAQRGTLIPLRDLCASFSPRLDSAFLAYAQSRSFVNYLRRQFGADGLLTLARAYANGVDCQGGPERAFGVTLVKLERDWQAQVLGRSDLEAVLKVFLPYLLLLCLVVFFPTIGILNALRKKGDAYAK